MQSILSIFPILVIIVLWVTALVMLFIRASRPDFTYYWLVAAVGGLIAWLAVLLTRLVLGVMIPLATWRIGSQSIGTLAIKVDSISWSFAFALSTLILAMIFSDVGRVREVPWSHWAGSLAFAGLGIVAVQAGESITLLLSWAALDILQFIIFFNFISARQSFNRLALAFAINAGGIMLYLLGGGSPISQLLSSVMRLCSLPFYIQAINKTRFQRSIGTIILLISAGVNLCLVARMALFSIMGSSVYYLGIFSMITAFYCSLSWVSVKDEFTGQTFWFMGTASLATASAVFNQPVASLLWAMVLILSGGLLFRFYLRNKYLLFIPILGVISASALPYTPSWEIGRLYATQLSLFNIVLLFSQSLLLTGYIRHTFRLVEDSTTQERWVYLIYPIGLVLLPMAHLLIRNSGWQDVVPFEPMWGMAYWSGIFAVGLIPFILGIRFLVARFIHIRLAGLINYLSLKWFFTFIKTIFRYLGNIVAFSSSVVEGESGMLWTLLLLALLFTFFAQGGLGR